MCVYSLSGGDLLEVFSRGLTGLRLARHRPLNKSEIFQWVY